MASINPNEEQLVLKTLDHFITHDAEDTDTPLIPITLLAARVRDKTPGLYESVVNKVKAPHKQFLSFIRAHEKYFHIESPTKDQQAGIKGLALLLRNTFRFLFFNASKTIDIKHLKGSTRDDYLSLLEAFPDYLTCKDSKISLGKKGSELGPEMGGRLSEEQSDDESPFLFSSKKSTTPPPRSSQSTAPPQSPPHSRTTRTPPIATTRSHVPQPRSRTLPLYVIIRWNHKEKSIIITDYNYTFQKLLSDFCPRPLQGMVCQTPKGQKWQGNDPIFRNFMLLDPQEPNIICFVDDGW